MIGITEPREPVAVSEIPSVIVEEITNLGDISPPKSGSKKRPASVLSNSPVRRSTRPKTSDLQYNTREAKFLETSQRKINDIIEDIKSGTPPEATISKLLSLEQGVVRFRAFHDRASR